MVYAINAYGRHCATALLFTPGAIYGMTAGGLARQTHF
jgi:hypothetical protein